MRRDFRLFVASGLLIGAALALVVSPFASDAPDGLEAVAARQGFADQATAPEVDSPLADYSVEGAGNDRLATGVSGLIGTLLTFGIGTGLFAVLRVVRPGGPESPDPVSGPA